MLESTTLKPKMLVKEVNLGNFEEIVLEDPSFEWFIIKVYKDQCPACESLGKLMMSVTHKM